MSNVKRLLFLRQKVVGAVLTSIPLPLLRHPDYAASTEQLAQEGGASYVETYHGNPGTFYARRGGMESEMAKN